METKLNERGRMVLISIIIGLAVSYAVVVGLWGSSNNN